MTHFGHWQERMLRKREYAEKARKQRYIMYAGLIALALIIIVTIIIT